MQTQRKSDTQNEVSTNQCNQRLLALWASCIVALKLYAVKDAGDREQRQSRTDTMQRKEGIERKVVDNLEKEQ
ncbi:Hypothetical predicted protein, partial [Scomber scombrus]